MSKCKEFIDKLSAYLDNELSSAESDMMREHINSCNLCQNEFEMLQSTKKTLKTMLPRTASEKTKERILSVVFEPDLKVYSEEGLRGGYLQERWKKWSRFRVPVIGDNPVYKGMALAASILLLIFISISDTTSSPVKLYVLEHQKCMTEGHKDYLCKTEHELSQKIENSMGVKAFIPTYFPEGFKFIKGDVCNIKGVTVAHMIMGDGKKMLSYFQGKGEIFKNGTMQTGRLENYKYASWKKDGVYCIVVGDMDEKEILRIASSQPE